MKEPITGEQTVDAFKTVDTYTMDDIYALPDGERAELIDGKIYYMAPPNTKHQTLVMELSYQIKDYIKRNDGGCRVFPAPFAVSLNKDDKNYVEPDISVICDEKWIISQSFLNTALPVSGYIAKSKFKWKNREGIIILAAVKGYYDGNQIILDEDARKNLSVGDEVIITVLDRINGQKAKTRAEKRRRLIESDAFVIPSGRTVEEVDEYIKEMRSNDRF